MKKLVALLLALCLLSACALAEEIPEIKWEDVDIESSGIEGNYYTFDDVAVVVWIPTILENLELTAEEAEGGHERAEDRKRGEDRAPANDLYERAVHHRLHRGAHVREEVQNARGRR